MKSITYIIEITTQKNEQYLSEGRNQHACLPACLLASCQLRILLSEFTEKHFAVFDQSSYAISHSIGCSYFSRNFLLSFLLLWYEFKILVKSRGGGTFLCLSLSVNVWQKQFFYLKAKYPVFHFLDLDGTILNLILPKINKKR